MTPPDAADKSTTLDDDAQQVLIAQSSGLNKSNLSDYTL